MKISPSLLKRWMICPLQVKFDMTEVREGLQNSKTTYGTCIHDALDQYNKTGDIEYAIKRFEYTWEHPEFLDAKIDVWSKYSTYGSLRRNGIELLSQYHDRNQWDDRKIIASEHKFCVPIGEHLISGVVDLLEVKKSSSGRRTLRVVDYKTSSKKPNKFTLSLDVQFTAYVYASLQPEFWMGHESDEKYAPIPDGEQLYQSFLNTDRVAIWYHFMENKEINCGPRDDNDFMRLYRCLLEIQNAIDKDVFVPNISGDSCIWCPYTDICQAVIPVRDKIYAPPQQELF